MSDNSSSKSCKQSESDQRQAPGHNRRRLLKALAGSGAVFAAGGVTPTAWQQPVVKSIVLPAHASLTCGSVQSYSGPIMLAFNGFAPMGMMDTLFSPVFAGTPSPETMTTGEICIRCNGDGTVNVRLLLVYAGDCAEIRPYYEDNNVPTGQTVELNDSTNCGSDFPASIHVTEVNGNAAGEVMAMLNNNTLWVGQFDIDQGGCTLEPPVGCLFDCDGP